MTLDLFDPKFLDKTALLGEIENIQKDIRYFIIDMPVELIRNKFNKSAESEGEIYIPKYQREMRWTKEDMSLFIESVLLRIPIPPLFFYENNGRLEVIDGSQRIRSIISFISEDFPLCGLEKLDILNGFYMNDLPDATKRKFLNTPIRAFTLEQDTDGTTRFDIFRRINTSAKRLEDAEIRKGAFQGVFLKLVQECAENKDFIRLISKSTEKNPTKKNMSSERQELVTRFFVYLDHYNEFSHDVRRFLDEKFVLFNEKMSSHDIERMRNEFLTMVNFFSTHFPDGFRRSKGSSIAPRVRFEALAVGVSLAIRENPSIQGHDFSWATEEPFISYVRTDASNSGLKLRRRIEYVRNRLLENE